MAHVVCVPVHVSSVLKILQNDQVTTSDWNQLGRRRADWCSRHFKASSKRITDIFTLCFKKMDKPEEEADEFVWMDTEV